jgi:glycosyltransferase involved in cell wall biosynthesis
MALWCNACDAGLQATRAEGFGLPLIEFQACGVPVITTDASAMTELCGAGWLVDGEPYWNDGHLAWWCTPHVGGITAALEQAYAGGAALAGKARAFALADALLPQWETVLDEIMAGWE